MIFVYAGAGRLKEEFGQKWPIIAFKAYSGWLVTGGPMLLYNEVKHC